MRVSLFQLLLVILALVSCLSEEVSTSEQPTRRSFFRRLGNVYKKNKQGLRNMLFWKKRVARETEEEGHVEQNPIGEGINAVMEAIDEIVADGEAAAKDAARSAKEAVEKSEEAVEQPVLESEDKIPTASAEAETIMYRTPGENAAAHEDAKEDKEDRNTNDEDIKVEVTASDAAPDTASDNTASGNTASGNTVSDRTEIISDAKEEL